jgi:hypothetical protein
MQIFIENQCFDLKDLYFESKGVIYYSYSVKWPYLFEYQSPYCSKIKGNYLYYEFKESICYSINSQDNGTSSLTMSWVSLINSSFWKSNSPTFQPNSPIIHIKTEMDNRQKISIIIGSVVGLISMLVLTWLVFWRWKRKKKSNVQVCAETNVSTN